MGKNRSILAIGTYSACLKMGLKTEKSFYSLNRKAINQEKILFKSLEKLLERGRLSLRDIETVCVVRGPGRFTGLRISLTFASMMKTLRGIKVYAADIFEILALKAQRAGFPGCPAWRKTFRIAVALKAFKKEYFLKFFDCQTLLPLHDAEWTGMERVFEKVRKDDYFLSDTEETDEIYQNPLLKAQRAPQSICRVKPVDIIDACLKWKRKEITPLYLKPAKYEIQAAGK